MKIEEIIRTCASEQVAAAAVSSIGRAFSTEVRVVADRYGMSTGGFTAFAVERFARLGDEREMRSVLGVMAQAQEPVLAGLHRILCITLASGVPSGERRTRDRAVRLPSSVCTMDADRRRDWAY